MRSTPISDRESFRESLRENSGADWPAVERLAESTGILAGSDGLQSRGIYCERCGFGFRREFGEFPVVEGRTSLANDFSDEAHRRECPHWGDYVEHPEAFFHCRQDRAQDLSDANRASTRVCERCGASAFATFRCLGRQLCFVCLADVARLTGGYPGLQTLISVKEAADPPPTPGRGKRSRGTGRCRTCRAVGTLVSVKNVGFCRPCAVSEIERALRG